MSARQSSSRVIRNNPFPEVPEVTLGLRRTPDVTIETKAVREADAFIREYLNADDGRSLAIVGDYGVGKSHLAAHAINRIALQKTSATICVIRAEFSFTLVDVYKNLFNQNRPAGGRDTSDLGLRRADLVRRIRDIYSEMAQERRLETRLHQRYGPREEPPEERPAWPGGAALADDVELTQALQARLSEITQDREFADGLSLLLHNDGEISGHAWEWLCGGPVTPHLEKRGVISQIVGGRALVGLQALARLFTEDMLRFVLVIDDIERLSGKQGDSGDLDVAVSSLVGWAAESRSLLIFAIMDRPWNKLSEGVRQRVGRIIRPAPLTEANIISYQQESYLLKRRRFSAGDIPDNEHVEFASGAFAKIRDITWGAPRKVVKICYDAYDHANRDGKITPAVIERVTAGLVGSPPTGEIYTQVRDFFAGQGHTVRRDHEVDGIRVPLWISATSDDTGCAVLVAESLLNSAAAAKVIRLGSALLGPADRPTRNGLVLVLSGIIAESQEPKVRRIFPHAVQWGRDTFWDELQAMVSNLIASANDRTGADLLQALQIAVGSLRSSQAEDNRILRQLVEAQDETRVRRLIREETHRAYLRSPGDAEPLSFGGLEDIQDYFDDAVSTVREALERVKRLWQSVFQSQQPARAIDRANAPGSRQATPDDLARGAIVRTIGVLTTLEDSLDSFGRSIIRFQRLSQSGRDAGRGDFYSQCNKFDKTAEILAAAIPAGDEDPDNMVFRVLGIDRVTIFGRIRSLGSMAFDSVHAPELKRP